MQSTPPQILLRSPRIAQRVFGLDSPGQIVRSVPRAKFMFKAEFFPSAAANSMMNNVPLNDAQDIRSIAFKVKSIDKPKVNLTTAELNHYNKKHLVYTKVDYQDCSIRIYDTVDNSILALWVNYFTYFFGDSRGAKDDLAYDQSPVNPKYYDSSGWGLRPISENVQFFNKVSIIAFYGQTMTRFTYINPRITSIDWQNKDYSSSDLEEVTINFKYEAIKYEKFGQPIPSEVITGWQPDDTIDYPYGYATAPAAYQPRLFSNQTATFNRPITSSTITNPANVVDSLPYNVGAIAPGAAIPTNLLNSQLLQPNNLVSGLAMAMNYIPNGIQGIQNFPFATVASLAGIQGIGGLSRMFGDAVRTQLSNLGDTVSGIFNSSQIPNIFQNGIPQPTGYMSGMISNGFPDITTNGDSLGSFVDPSALSGAATSPGVDLGTSDLGIGASSQGSYTFESQLPNSEEAAPFGSIEFASTEDTPIGSIEYVAVEDTPPPDIFDQSGDVGLADYYSSNYGFGA